MSDRVVTALGLPPPHGRPIRRALAELRRCEAAYRGYREPLSLAGRIVIIVDDGMATRATMRAAVHTVRESRPSRIIAAAAVAARATCDMLETLADEVVCPWTPESLSMVGLWTGISLRLPTTKFAPDTALERKGSVRFAHLAQWDGCSDEGSVPRRRGEGHERRYGWSSVSRDGRCHVATRKRPRSPATAVNNNVAARQHPQPVWRGGLRPIASWGDWWGRCRLGTEAAICRGGQRRVDGMGCRVERVRGRNHGPNRPGGSASTHAVPHWRHRLYHASFDALVSMRPSTAAHEIDGAVG